MQWWKNSELNKKKKKVFKPRDNFKKKILPKGKSYKDYIKIAQRLHPKESSYFRSFSKANIETII